MFVLVTVTSLLKLLRQNIDMFPSYVAVIINACLSLLLSHDSAVGCLMRRLAVFVFRSAPMEYHYTVG